mmetsp:Transcript_30007/g.72463  ORF Transcript_30007/g.72463 Transcript_30007/m.72463 type:complete len:288 (-) Transcript_30007:473-1336(-)
MDQGTKDQHEGNGRTLPGRRCLRGGHTLRFRARSGTQTGRGTGLGHAPTRQGYLRELPRIRSGVRRPSSHGRRGQRIGSRGRIGRERHRPDVPPRGQDRRRGFGHKLEPLRPGAARLPRTAARTSQDGTRREGGADETQQPTHHVQHVPQRRRFQKGKPAQVSDHAWTGGQGLRGRIVALPGGDGRAHGAQQLRRGVGARAEGGGPFPEGECRGDVRHDGGVCEGAEGVSRWDERGVGGACSEAGGGGRREVQWEVLRRGGGGIKGGQVVCWRERRGRVGIGRRWRR